MRMLDAGQKKYTSDEGVGEGHARRWSWLLLLRHQPKCHIRGTAPSKWYRGGCAVNTRDHFESFGELTRSGEHTHKTVYRSSGGSWHKGLWSGLEPGDERNRQSLVDIFPSPPAPHSTAFRQTPRDNSHILQARCLSSLQF